MDLSKLQEEFLINSEQDYYKFSRLPGTANGDILNLNMLTLYIY